MTNTANLQTKLDNSLAIYFKEIDSIPLMTREEEYELAVKAKQGDILARDRIVKANLRFVVSVAKKYQSSAFELNDLINEGNIGLMIAIDKFDPEKGYHFISYAVWWIRQTILKAIYEKGKMIRLPSNKTNDIIKIEKARKSLKAKLSEEEELEQVAIMLNMTPLHVQEMMMISKDVFSLDSKVGGDESDSNSLGEMLEDTTSVSPEERVIQNDMKNQIDNVLSTLTAKEAEILRYRFGLNGKKAMSLKEVGEVFNLTKERIRQIEKKAIKRLQHPTRSVKLEAFIA
jgi:RNA polymerase primary sigma factor